MLLYRDNSNVHSRVVVSSIGSVLLSNIITMENAVTLFVFIFNKWKIKNLSWIISDCFVISLYVHIFMCEGYSVCACVCAFLRWREQRILHFSLLATCWEIFLYHFAYFHSYWVQTKESKDAQGMNIKYMTYA